MLIEVPDHHAGNISVMLASIGYQIIRDEKMVPTSLFQLSEMFNQLTEDDEGPGDFFETIAQKFDDVRDIIRADSAVQAQSSYKAWA